jgi:hypothetical protein
LSRRYDNVMKIERYTPVTGVERFTEQSGAALRVNLKYWPVERSSKNMAPPWLRFMEVARFTLFLAIAAVK